MINICHQNLYLVFVVYQRSRILLEDNNIEEDDFETGNKIKRFYRACINESRSEERGVKPLLNSLNTLGGWPILEGDKDYSTFAWYEQLYILNKNGFGIDTVLDHFIEIDSKNNSWRVITLDQPNFGLSKEYLVDGKEHKLVKEYFRYMIAASELLGANREMVEEELESALEFEISLAKISATKEQRRDGNKKYNPTTIENMTSLGDLVHPPSWQKHFQTIIDDVLSFHGDQEEDTESKGIDISLKEKVNIKDRFFFGNLTELIRNTDPRTIANYMAWRVVESQMNNLNQAARNLKEAFDREVKGTNRLPPTWKRCVKKSGFNSYQRRKLAAGAGSMYVRKHFDLEEKRDLGEMFSYTRHAFEKLLANTEWMDDETKKNAVKKMKKMDQVVAYPDELLDDEVVDGFYKGNQDKPYILV